MGQIGARIGAVAHTLHDRRDAGIGSGLHDLLELRLVDLAAVGALYAEWLPYGAGVTNYLAAPDMPTNAAATEFDLPGGTIMGGDLEFGVAQSDRQYQAVKGIEDWKDKGPQEDLRAVFSIHPETVDLIAAVDAWAFALEAGLPTYRQRYVGAFRSARTFWQDHAGRDLYDAARIIHDRIDDPAIQATSQAVMDAAEITVRIDLGRGDTVETVLTCDLSYDYVRINAEYRT